MPSPVVKDSIPVINGSMESCDAFRAILQTVREVAKLTEWMFDDDGLPQVSVAREIGAIVFPPGATMDIVFPQGTSRETVRAQVEKMWLTETEQDAYNETRESVEPFWVVADEEERNGAPNMAGRFKLNADFRLLDGGNVSGLVGLEFPGGAKDHTLTISEGGFVNHTHLLGHYGTDAESPASRRADGVFHAISPAVTANEEEGWRIDADEIVVQKTGNVNSYNIRTSGIYQPTQTPGLVYDPVPGRETATSVQAHNNMPPYHIVITAYRTTRTS